MLTRLIKRWRTIKNVAKWRELAEFQRTQPTVGAMYKKLHELWKEGTWEEEYFLATANENYQYVYYH